MIIDNIIEAGCTTSTKVLYHVVCSTRLRHIRHTFRHRKLAVKCTIDQVRRPLMVTRGALESQHKIVDFQKITVICRNFSMFPPAVCTTNLAALIRVR
ncbi:hypothetical protein BDR04DRAFT_178044 [Suillus decipiens]|nr:hypothetical protein BDR04DRAFT_178044 [Suillus decipiens]